MVPIGEGSSVIASKAEIEVPTEEEAKEYLKRVAEERLRMGMAPGIENPDLTSFCLVEEKEGGRTIETYLLVAVRKGGEEGNFYWVDPQGCAYEGGPEKIRPWAEIGEGKMVCLFRGRGGGEVTTLKLSMGGHTDISAPPYGGETSVRVGERTFTFHFCGVSNLNARAMLRRYRIDHDHSHT